MLDDFELDLVRAYRAGVPEPDAATIAAARTELLEAIAQEPAPAGHQPRSVRTPRSESSRRRLQRLQRRRRLVLAGALAAAGLGVAGLLGLDTAATPVSALAAQMKQLAKIAANQRWTGIPGPGQYLYTASQGITESDTMGNDQECSVSQVEHRQIWIATDGSGALNDVRDQSRFTSAADQASCAAMKITDPSSQNSSWQNRFPAGGLSFPTNDWRSLSTDPATLLKQVHERDGGPDTPGEWFVNVTDFLRESDVPPAIRSALYQALALIPGVRLLGPQTDSVGQSGIGVGFYRDGQLATQLIFDQANARLLYEAYYDGGGTPADWTAYTQQKIVDTLPDYPMAQATTSTPTSSAGSKAPGVS